MNRPKYLLIICLALLATLSALNAQRLTVLSTSASSGIDYYAATGERQRVFAGIELPEGGELVLSEGRSANVVAGGRKLTVNGPVKIMVNKLIEDAEAEGESSFLGRFWRFISSSVKSTGSSQDIQQYHRRYLTNTRAGVEGYGDVNYAIQLPGYLSRTFSSGMPKISWAAPPGVENYLLTIVDRADETEVLSARTSRASFTLPLSDLALDPEGVYILRITAEREGERITSPEIFFNYAPLAVAAFEEASREKAGKRKLDGTESALYLPFALEEEGYLEPAYRAYQKLIDAEPENLLYRKAYAAFLLRMDAPREAQMLLGYE